MAAASPRPVSDGAATSRPKTGFVSPSLVPTQVDTGAGEVVMEDDGMMVAKVYPDPTGAVLG